MLGKSNTLYVAVYDPQQHNPHVVRSALDPGVVCLTYAAYARCALGYPDQALKRSQEALRLAQKSAHPFSLAYAHYGAAVVHLNRNT